MGLLLLPLLAACGADESAPDMPQEGCPINFATTVEDTQTRSGALATDNLLSVGIFAYYTGSDDWTTADIPNFMYNQEVKRTNASSPWTYSPVKYWPNNSADKISFFAYAPYNAAGATLSDNIVAGFPYIDYTVPTAEADQTDLLATMPLMNQSYAGNPAASGNINFTMKHALTKVTLKVKSGDKYAKEITSLSVKTATGGKLQFKDGGFEWKNITGSHAYIPAATTNLKFAVTDAGRDVATFFFLPTSAVTATFSITYTVKAATGTEIQTKTITDHTLPASPLWEAGKSITYTINLSEETVTVTVDAGNSGNWASSGSEEKTVKYYTADELKPGDYYYNDGTTSDGGLRKSVTTNDGVSGGQTADMLEGDEYECETKSPVSGKVCIGIVFYTGQGKGDDAANYSSFGITQIDGYVVALNDCSKSSIWGPVGDIDGIYNSPPTTDVNFNGFANTEKVKALGNYSTYWAFYYAVNYSVARPATKATTWYLPSVAQLRTIYSAHSHSLGSHINKVIGLNIKKAGGASYDPSRYWSSTPYGSGHANYVGFAGGDMGLDIPKNTDYKVRSILTFQRVTN